VNRSWLDRADIPGLMDLPSTLSGLAGETSRQASRPTVWRWAPPWAKSGRLVVRQYAHGGVLGPLLGTLFLRPSRMRREFQVALHAMGAGVLTAAPVALRLERMRGLLFRAHLVTEEIAEARDLLEVLRGLAAGNIPSPEARADLARAVASTVAAMHNAGIVHGDLNVRNLMVRNAFDGPEVFVIDFDKARPVPYLTSEQREANLLRLERSIWKWAESRRTVSTTDRLRFLRAYVERCPGFREEWIRSRWR
jgi:tRNA A-37 threonylcarbamoyl transferase component Bud32